MKATESKTGNRTSNTSIRLINVFKTIKDYYGDSVEISGRKVYLTVTDFNQTKTIVETIPNPPQRKDLNYDLIKYYKYMFK